jgi:hypothetical protein
MELEKPQELVVNVWNIVSGGGCEKFRAGDPSLNIT